MKFELIAEDKSTRARAGVLHTDHGPIETPIFMPVGTVGTVKGVFKEQLTEQVKAQIILGNTYHLYLRPGTDIIEKAGGLHKFNNWSKPILTDSGGFQVFSLADARKLTEEGALFRSHIDGSKHLFTPENVIDTQRSIGADIIMAFDECTRYPATYEYAQKSMERTHRWLQRCMDHFHKTEPKYGYEQSLFPIVQGSTYKDLRTQSAEVISSHEADGYAIGGLSVGEPEEMMYEMTDLVCGILPQHKPRYLMGVGTPWNILENISLGIDMFDCVMPTRNGRNGMMFTSQGIMNIKNKKWEDQFEMIDPALGADHLVNQYSKAYVRHLFVAKELLGMQIASLQNLSFYLHLVKTARQHIIDGTFGDWKSQMIKQTKERL